MLMSALGRLSVIRLLPIVAAAAFTCHALADDATTVVLTIKAHRFEPASVTLPVDQAFTLVVRNADDTAEEFESPDLHLEKIVMPGKELQFKLPGRRAGRYRYFGDFHQDSAQGVLVVQ